MYTPITIVITTAIVTFLSLRYYLQKYCPIPTSTMLSRGYSNNSLATTGSVLASFTIFLIIVTFSPSNSKITRIISGIFLVLMTIWLTSVWIRSGKAMAKNQ